MPHALLRGWAITSLTLAMCVTSNAQEVSPAAALESGRTWTYQLEFDLLINQEIEGESRESSRILQSARVEFFVADADEDGAEIDLTFERLSLVLGLGGEQMEYAWSAQGGGRGADPRLKSLMLALVESGLTLRVDAEGKLEAVSGLEPAMAALETAGGLDARALGVFTPTLIADALEPIWRGDGLVEGARADGDGWQRVIERPLGAAGQLVFTRSFVVMSVDDGQVGYAADEMMELEPPVERDPEDPTMTPVEHAGRIEAAWSLDAGAISERTAERRLIIDWAIDGVKLRQSQQSTLTHTLMDQD